MSSLRLPLGIYAAGSFSQRADEQQLSPLKQLVQEKSGASPRRISRFIQLALIGAGDCIYQKQIPADTAVYLASENGDTETTVSVLQSMYVEGQPPKPLSFINTVSNAACFYVAKTFGLEGENSFISSINSAMESCLLNCVVDLSLDRIPAALVGVVDSCTSPLSDHGQRIRAGDRDSLGEGSHWLLLAPTDRPVGEQQPLALLEQVGFVNDLDSLAVGADFVGDICPGVHMTDSDCQVLQARYPDAVLDRRLDQQPFYNSIGASILPDYVSGISGTGVAGSSNKPLLYVNRSAEESFSYCLLSKEK